MPLDEQDTKQITSIFAEALRLAVSEATQAAVSAMSQQQHAQEGNIASANMSAKPPPFSCGEYKETEMSSVENYFDRFDLALNLSRIPKADHQSYARIHMGMHLNEALKFLIHPNSPESCTYEEIKKVLVGHFDRKRNKYAESVKFRQTTQNKDEPIANFVLRLRQAAMHCEYGEFIDRMLTEQLIFGIESRMACDEIISKNPGTFKEAYEIAHALEATHQITSTVKTSPENPFEQTNKLGYAPVQAKRKTFPTNSTQNQTNFRNGRTTLHSCHGCGGKHLRNQCKFRDATCFVCGRKGHISKVCQSKTHQISDEQLPSDSDSVHELNMVNIVKDKIAKRKMINTHINGTGIKMELDTGAPCGIIGKKTFKGLKLMVSGVLKENFLVTRVTQSLAWVGYPFA